MSAIVLLLLLTLAPPDRSITLEKVGTLAHPPIREASGLVKSRRFPGVYWVHNDSGNPAVLFAVRGDGSLIREYAVEVPNIDWEAIAIDDHGHLSIGEIGNNGGRLPLRAIYQVAEPDPTKPVEGVLKLEKASYYRFPENGRFDAESLMIAGGQAWIISKTFDKKDAVLYSIPLRPPAPLLRPAIPEKIAILPGFTDPATGADLTPDGRLLVVCSVGSFGVYEKEKEGRWKRLTLRTFKPVDQIEAVAWDGLDILLAGESRAMFRVPERVWRKSVERHD